MDVTNYLSLYHMTEKEMAVELMRAVMEETGITATAGIGTNLYLAKIANRDCPCCFDTNGMDNCDAQ